jgi:hypothetical protein
VNSSRVSALSILTSLETLSTSLNSFVSQNLGKDQLDLSLEQKQLDYEKQKNLLQKQ